MHKDKLRELLVAVREQAIPIDAALKKLENLPYEDLGFAHIDHHRALRKGFPEVVFCQKKTPEQAVEIIRRLVRHNDVLATKASPKIYRKVRQAFENTDFNELAGTIVVRSQPNSTTKMSDKNILVVCAGTSDISVAEEAVVTAELMRNRVEKLYDVGIAGIHRLLNNNEKIREANVLIVVAGMDGALPAVVSGLVSRPVVAVPTSVGYGASFEGIAPLLTMLNACAPGVTVVNIDNGFGAGYFASLINKSTVP